MLDTLTSNSRPESSLSLAWPSILGDVSLKFLSIKPMLNFAEEPPLYVYIEVNVVLRFFVQCACVGYMDRTMPFYGRRSDVIRNKVINRQQEIYLLLFEQLSYSPKFPLLNSHDHSHEIVKFYQFPCFLTVQNQNIYPDFCFLWAWMRTGHNQCRLNTWRPKVFVNFVQVV